MNDNSGIYLPSKDSSSSLGFEFHTFPSEITTSVKSNSTASNIPQEQYHYLITQFDLLNTSVRKLESSSSKTDCFMKQSVLLQRVCLVVIILLPFIVAASAACTVWWLSTDENLVSYAKGYLCILGISGVVDLIFVFATEKIRTSRLNEIEKRISKLEKQ